MSRPKPKKDNQLEEFRDLLQIDRNNLDDELIGQSSGFFRVSEAQVLASSKADELKEALALVDADLDAIVRQELDDKNEKDTVAKVQAGINTHPDHIEAMDDYLASHLEANQLRAMKDSFSMRSSMLKNLVELICTQYHTVEKVRAPAT